MKEEEVIEKLVEKLAPKLEESFNNKFEEIKKENETLKKQLEDAQNLNRQLSREPKSFGENLLDILGLKGGD